MPQVHRLRHARVNLMQTVDMLVVCFWWLDAARPPFAKCVTKTVTSRHVRCRKDRLFGAPKSADA
eukprot:11370457-Alexandrium_andersonii.AAC.1